MSTQVGPTGAEILVTSLAAEGVDTIFGLPGLQLDYIFDALYDRQATIRVIHTRHEQATAYMAFGYAQASGRVGTCLVVPGPGVLNATAALSTAYACNAPVLCITGQIPSAHIGGGLGFLHEIPDQTGLLASVSKWQRLVKSPADAANVVQAAFRELNSGRRRPVVIEIPPDIAAARSPEIPAGPPAAPIPPPQPDPYALARAAALLGRARNPAIFVEGNPPHPPMISPWSSWPGAFCALPQISCVGFAVNIAKLPDLEPVTRPGPPQIQAVENCGPRGLVLVRP